MCSWNEECRADRLISIASPSTHRFLVEKFVAMYQFSDRIAAGIAEELETRFGRAVWTEFSPSEIVKTIGVPGLIIHGREDDFVPAAHAEQLRSNWSQAKVEIVDGVNHFDAVISPQVRGLITRYLSESL